MGKILLGVILILLRGTINIETHIIELTPNFIGSVLLLSAMKEFKIKDNIMKRFLYVLTGIFFVNYMLQVTISNGILFVLYPILNSGTLVWGIYIAMKLVENIKSDQGIGFKTEALRVWFWILFAITIIMGITVIVFVPMPRIPSLLNIVLPWILGLTAFVGAIASYILIYLFYKELKDLKLSK